MIEWVVTHSTPFPNRGNLINSLGKCVRVDSTYVYQFDCDQSNNGMLWSWNQISFGSSDRHICNAHGKCLASVDNRNWSMHLIAFTHRNEQGQKFNFVDSSDHPGFYIIKNDHGKCLSVNGNTNKNGAHIWVNDCNPSEMGQHWKWRNLIFTYCLWLNLFTYNF